MKTKTIQIQMKAVGDSDEGRFQAYAAVFGNKDSYGDVIVAGAFAESLAEYGTKGDGVPVYWCHRMDDPFMNLGSTLEAKEDDHGLWVDIQLDLETASGKQVHKLLKDGRVTQMSFAYDVLEGAWVERDAADGGSFYELRKLRLHEVSIVPIGANQETEILAVKAASDAVEAGVNSGRTLSVKSQDELRAAYESLGRVLNTSTSDEKSSGAPEAKDEEPEGAKSEELTGAPALRDMTAQLNLYALSGGKGDSI